MGFTRLLDTATVERYMDGSRRVIIGDDIPLGRKIQAPGPRCRRWRHEWKTDTYPGVRHEYVDRVCARCSRRKMVK